MLEKIIAEIKRRTFENDKNDSPCVQFVAISDMAGYSYRQLANMKGFTKAKLSKIASFQKQNSEKCFFIHLAVQSIIQTVSVYEAHYPETMAQCIIINGTQYTLNSLKNII